MASTNLSLGGHSCPPCSANHSWHFRQHCLSAPQAQMEKSYNLQLSGNECPKLKMPFIFDHSGSVQNFSLSIPVCVMHVEREHLVFMLFIINYKCNSRSFFNTICKCSQRLLSDWYIK